MSLDLAYVSLNQYHAHFCYLNMHMCCHNLMFKILNLLWKVKYILLPCKIYQKNVPTFPHIYNLYHSQNLKYFSLIQV